MMTREEFAELAEELGKHVRFTGQHWIFVIVTPDGPWSASSLPTSAEQVLLLRTVVDSFENGRAVRAVQQCECGAELRYARGAGAEGWLCPSCDAEHLRELEELGGYRGN